MQSEKHPRELGEIVRVTWGVGGLDRRYKFVEEASKHVMTQIQPPYPKVDHLILLVGGNPLPNYVAARLLLKDGGQLCLVHTDTTFAMARRLHQILLPEDAALVTSKQVTYLKVDEGDPRNIYDQVVRHVKDKSFGVHLNYTGGTKTMSVHAVLAIEDTCPDYAEFSYLDARRLSLLMHRANRSGSRAIPVGDKVDVSLDTLMALHEGKYDPNHAPPTDQINVELLPLCRAIVKVCGGTKNGLNKWKDWQSKSKGFTQLPFGIADLETVDESLISLCNGDPTPASVAQKIGFEELRSCQKWFRSDFFELHIHHTLQQAIEKIGNGFAKPLRDIHCTLDVRVSEDEQSIQGNVCDPYEFQFDVAVMRHYQLVAISCLLSADIDRCKEHLLECYVRARQLGGDEAQVALVCAYGRPKEIECKLASIWGASTHIKVFGAPHLSDLETHLYDWLK